MTTRRARISNMSLIRQQKIAPALPVAETQRLFQQPFAKRLAHRARSGKLEGVRFSKPGV